MMEYIRSIEHKEVVHRCFRCGYCKFPRDYVDFNCPSYKVFGWDTYAPGGRMWLIRAWLKGEIETSDRFAEILYSCSACGNCQEHCPFPRFSNALLDVFEEVKAELVNDGKIPPPVRDYFKAISVNGNPYKLPREERGKWAQSIGLERYSGQEFLLYVGCVASYDEVGQKMARSVAKVLLSGGLSMGILAEEESCDGAEVKVLGETELFKELARENIEKFRKKGVTKIITMDPHALHVFRNFYPALGGRFQVYHYSEILAGLIKEGKVRPGRLEGRVTYHDPCYLGRHNKIYGAPRRILKAIEGLELVEMRRNRENSFCCGGGGGNFFTDILGRLSPRPSKIRFEEATVTGATILAVACPLCAKMLTDACKEQGEAASLEVMDLAEVVGRSMGISPP
jgi:Fe-S oxidoreductase